MNIPFFRCLAVVASMAVLSGQEGKPAATASADFVFPGKAATLPAALTQALAGVTAKAIGTHITMLASPGFEGRGLGQPGLDATADYVASVLARYDVRPLIPARDKGVPTAAYFQLVPTREITRPSGQLTVSHHRSDATSTRTFQSGVDCLFQERPPATVTAPVVFAGYGIRETALGRDDYRDLAVEGRVVLILDGVPPGPHWQTKELRSKYASDSSRQRYEVKAELAQALGALAVVAIAGEEFPVLLASGDSAPASRYFVPYGAGADNDGTIPVVRVSTTVADTLLAASGMTAAAAPASVPQSLPGAVVSIRSAGDERLVVSRNVVAAIPGADPVLRDQVVIIGAHMDHLGRSDNTIYPGADDNASGTAALLEIARAFAASPHKPKRTVVFVFWTGEEEGHLGSEHYARYPLLPFERTVVYLNLDMIGHPWTADEIRTLVADTRLEKGTEFLAAVKTEDFFELGVPPTAPDLDPILKQAARGTGVALHLDRTDGRSGGSDYRAFARKGRPFVRLFGNYFDGYHEPTDTADRVDAAQVRKVAALAFASAWLLADR